MVHSFKYVEGLINLQQLESAAGTPSALLRLPVVYIPLVFTGTHARAYTLRPAL